MDERILVALRRWDRVEHVLPYLDMIARPETKIVFLFHYAGGFDKYLDWRCTSRPEFFFTASNGGEPPPDRRRLPEEERSPGSEAFLKIAAKIEIAVYSGRFRKAVSQYMGKGDVQLLLLPGGRSNWLRRLWQNIFSIRRPFKSPTLRPVVLFRADNAGGK